MTDYPKKDLIRDIVGAVLIAACGAFLVVWAYSALSANAEEPAAEAIPEMESVSESDELAQEHRSHEVEAVEAGKLDAEGVPIDGEKPIVAKMRGAFEQKLAEVAANQAESEQEAEEEYVYAEMEYEPVYEYYGGYSGGSTATTTHDLLNGQGRASDNGISYTFYYHDIGYGPLDIPGENFDSDGVSYDGDGYIVVASRDHARGEVIDTPYGEAKVYDYCPTSGVVDIYTNL